MDWQYISGSVSTIYAYDSAGYINSATDSLGNKVYSYYNKSKDVLEAVRDANGKYVLSAKDGSTLLYNNLNIDKNSGTMTVWFNTSGDTGTTRYILVSKTSSAPLLCVYTKPDNKVYVGIRDSAGAWVTAVTSSNTITANTWNFIALTWSTVNGVLSLGLRVNDTKKIKGTVT